ncbi:MAG TPA: hypothetical protein VFP00_00680 [Burkholderiales bacterium]|nr:hypothetical protein [Burkholderiales bacterium]
MVLLERVNAFRGLMAILLPALRDPAAREQAFRNHSQLLRDASRSFGIAQQECIVDLLDEIRIAYGLTAGPDQAP